VLGCLYEAKPNQEGSGCEHAIYWNQVLTERAPQQTAVIASTFGIGMTVFPLTLSSL